MNKEEIWPLLTPEQMVRNSKIVREIVSEIDPHKPSSLTIDVYAIAMRAKQIKERKDTMIINQKNTLAKIIVNNASIGARPSSMFQRTMYHEGLSPKKSTDNPWAEVAVNVYNDVVGMLKDVRNTKAVMATSPMGAASDIVLIGSFAQPELSVTVSHLIGPESTVTVVFSDASKPIGQNSRTRHYQPAQYLGRRADPLDAGKTISNSAVYETDVTRRDEANIHLDIFHYLKEGKLPK